MSSRMRLKGATSSLAARAAAGGLVLAVALTACGGSGSGEQGGSGATQAVQGSYKKTMSAGTVKISLAGSQQAAKKSSKQQSQSTVSGQSVLNFAKNSSSTTVNAAGSNDSETRAIDNIRYQKVTERQRAQVPGKKPWIKVDVQQLAKAKYGKQANAMLDNPPIDPAGMLAYLPGVTTAQQSGKGTVRGAQTTHYKAKVNLKRAAKDQGPEIAQRFQQLGQQLGKRPLSLHVWLDGKDRVRRLKTTLPSAQSGGGGGLVLTEEFYDYGSSVQVEPPPEDKTASMTEQILKQQQMREQMQRMQQQQQQQQQAPQPSSS